ncbi:unnamed protein product, partial [Mesorhabditis spiculigera]
MFSSPLISFLCGFILTTLESATIDKPVSVKDSDATLQKLIYGVGLHGVNDKIRDTAWWIPVGGGYQATRLVTATGGDHHYTWQFKITAQKSTCPRASVTFSKVKNCKADPAASRKKSCSVYISYSEKRPDDIDSEVYCQ